MPSRSFPDSRVSTCLIHEAVLQIEFFGVIRRIRKKDNLSRRELGLGVKLTASNLCYWDPGFNRRPAMRNLGFGTCRERTQGHYSI